MCTVDSTHACSDALLKLQPGDSIVYHVGLLARDRNDGMKAMIAEHRIELKQIKGEVETIRTTVTSHVAKEECCSRFSRRCSASASPSAAR